MSVRSLAAMANGGVYDHVGGGFARYRRERASRRRLDRCPSALPMSPSLTRCSHCFLLLPGTAWMSTDTCLTSRKCSTTTVRDDPSSRSEDSSAELRARKQRRTSEHASDAL